MTIKTNEEALELLKSKYGKPETYAGVVYKSVFAAYPEGYNKIYPGFACLMGVINTKTEDIDHISGIHVFPNGECSTVNNPRSKNRIEGVDIDWEKGTATPIDN